MSFITDADLLVDIRTYRMEQIVDGDDSIITLASAQAEAHILDCLVNHYDAVAILNQAGANRHQNVINWCKNLVLYYIYKRVPDAMVPDRVVKDYDDTMDFLQKIAEGRVKVALPKLAIVDSKGEKKTTFRGGSDRRRGRGRGGFGFGF